jgi:hypothetical protein
MIPYGAPYPVLLQEGPTREYCANLLDTRFLNIINVDGKSNSLTSSFCSHLPH